MRKVARGALEVQEEENAKRSEGRASRGRREKVTNGVPDTSGQLKYNDVGSPIR